jgi:phage terminase large subunit
MGGVTTVTVPYRPRPLQRVLHAAIEAHRFSVAVCHRRFGKTVLGINHLQKAALTCQKDRPRFAYIAPTYRQGKAVAWDYMKHYARPVPHTDPHETELRIDYPNHGQVRIYGADNPDALRGIYLDGVVLDEYGLMPNNVFSEVIRPLLTDRQGWALFIGTPNGQNQFYDIAKDAQKEPGWFFASYKASQTGLIAPAELASARASMTADEYAQEFECSFEASIKGAVFATELQQAREEGRITRVPYEPMLPVETDWDLGVRDRTAIWFSQTTPGGEVRLVDYYENEGQGLQHYATVLSEKRNTRGFNYGLHYAPHDIQVRELGTGHSRWETARGLGLHFQIGKALPLADGINASRMLLPRCWFDADACARGLEALQNYRWYYNTRMKEHDRGRPEHDWASHGADAFRGLAQRHRMPRARLPKQVNLEILIREREELRKAQRDTHPLDAPGGMVLPRGGRRMAY